MRLHSKKPKVETLVITGVKPNIHNIYILDRSGSMSGGKYKASCESVIKELEILNKDENVNYYHTIVEFDGGIENNVRLFKHCWIKPNNVIGTFNWVGTQGNTPLYRALGEILSNLKSEIDPNDRVLVKIFTDGGDTDRANTSGQSKYTWNKESISVLLNKLISVDLWTLTFNCTKWDKQSIQSIGIPEANILTHDNTAESIEEMGFTRSRSTVMYANAVSTGASAKSLVSNFYSKSI